MNELQLVWGWQPALYLFLGGMGAGAFVAAAVLHLRKTSGGAKTIAASMWAATLCLIVGLLCLLSELTAPLRGLMMWQSFSHFTSWMTIGAWVVFCAVVVFGLAALTATDKTAAIVAKVWKKFPERRAGILRILCCVGLVFGVGVAAYTGILLMAAPGVPLWNSFLLPCVFTASALDTGVALVEVIDGVNAKKSPLSASAHKLLYRSVIVLVIAEALSLAALLASAATFTGGAVSEAAANSAGLLLSGSLAPWFWVLVALIGLVLPLIGAAAALAKSRRKAVAAVPDHAAAEEVTEPATRSAESHRASGIALVGAAGALVGGCALRFLVLMAGLHADPVANTMANLFQGIVDSVL